MIRKIFDKLIIEPMKKEHIKSIEAAYELSKPLDEYWKKVNELQHKKNES